MVVTPHLSRASCRSGSNDASPPLKLRKVAVKAGGRGRVKRAQQQRSKRSLYKDMDRVATEQGRSQRRLKSGKLFGLAQLTPRSRPRCLASSSSSRSKLSNVFRATRASGLEYAKPLTEAQRRKREANALRKHEQQVALTAALEARSDSVYELARRELHKARVVGREEELAHLLRFVGGCLERKQGGSVYVYGPSGVGKSATVAHTAAELETRHQFKVLASASSFLLPPSLTLLSKRVTLNLAAESVVDLCRETLERVALLGKAFVATLSEEQVKAALRDTLRERATLMVIEEADHGPHLDSLRTLWAMANDERLRLILVATGNTLNFASDALRHLPMRELHFAPYTGAQIAEIIRQRLTPAVVERIFDPRALQLLGDRVSKESGDLRAAVAMVGRALDAAEDEHNTRVDDGPMVGRVTVSVMSRASETQASSAGRINAIASLAPVSRQLLGALVKERQLHRGGESVFGEHDIRRVFREAMRVDRLDHKELRLALEALQDAMLLDWDDTRRSCTLKVDLRIAQQALTDDQGLQALQID